MTRPSHASIAALLLWVAACSGSQKGPEGPSPAFHPEPIEIEPLAFAALASEPGWGLLLGTGEGKRATKIPLVREPRVLALAAPGAGGDALVTLRLRAAPAGAEEASVAFEVGGDDPGDAARLAFWQAARMAAATAGTDLVAVGFAGRSARPLEGRALSALAATGLTAALTGAEIDGEATVVATLLPDGSLGPAASPRRLAAAAAVGGVRRLGLPPGEALELGDGGPEVVRVSDLGEAFELLTGARLPSPRPIAPKAMGLSERERGLLAAQAATWRQRAAAHWARVVMVQAGGGAPEELKALAAAAEREGELAERAIQKGRAAAARDRIAQAAVLAEATDTSWRVLEKVREGELEAASRLLDGVGAMEEEASGLLEEVAEAEPGGFWGMLAQVEGEEKAVRAEALARVAKERAEEAREGLAAWEEPGSGSEAGSDAERGSGTDTDTETESEDPTSATLPPEGEGQGRGEPERSAPITKDDLLRRILAAALARARARAALIEARDLAAFAPPGEALAPAVPRERASALAGTYAAVAGAAVPLLDQNDRAARAVTAHALSLAEKDAGLGAAFLAYQESAPRLAAAAAFGLAPEPTSERLTSPGPHEALAALLPIAERRARQHAGAARVATGAVPLRARRDYQAARALAAREEPALKLAALFRFWRASLASELAVALARGAKSAPPAPPKR